MKLVIMYKNGKEDWFDEKDLDCSKLTIRGHASALVDSLKNMPIPSKGLFYTLDHYNTILVDEVVSVRVVK